MEAISCGSYTVYFEQNGFNQLKQYIRQNRFTQLVVLADHNTYTYCYDYAVSSLELETPPVVFTFPPGEKNKNLLTCEEAWNFLLQHQIDKQALVINLGGGTVTDLGGFVAATYQRGIPYVHIPTSLLAMVDASVGGKTGIDFQGIKNQIGVVSPPQMVVIDTYFLKTLAPAELHSGIAEVLKHGLIASETYWNEVTSQNLDSTTNWLPIVYQSVEIKNKIVSQDPFENSIRKYLNYGHTLGHAIEAFSLSQHHNPLTHGHAVAIGMILATYLSVKKFELSESVLNRLVRTYHQYYSPVDISPSDIEEIIEWMKYDKKNRNKQTRFVLLKAVGQPVLDCEIEVSLLQQAFAYYAACKTAV